MNTYINEAEVGLGIPEQFRCYFLVSVANNLSRDNLPVIEALWEAVRLFAPAARLSRPAQIMIATRPFRVILGSGVLEYHPREEVIGCAIEHIVFLDILKLMPLHPNLRVACILEEFVHALMHVRDEQLTSVIVAHLYRGVTLISGRYAPVAKMPLLLATPAAPQA